MKAPTHRTATVLVIVTLAPHGLWTVTVGLAALAVLVYAGIMLPAIWSAKPARRKAAMDVLKQIFKVLRR
jgi:hypothetical protein